MAKLTDKLVGKGTGTALSPNPNGTGYTRQIEVDSLVSVESPESNVLYICKGRHYKYLRESVIDPGTNEIVVPAGWNRVENGPNSYKKDGGRGTPVHKNVAPQVPPRVFNEPVALNGGVTIKGKTIEELINQGGGDDKPTPIIYEVGDDLTTISSDIIAQLNVGDVVVVKRGGVGVMPLEEFSGHVIFKNENEVQIATLDSVVNIFAYVLDEDDGWVYDEDLDEEIGALYLHDIRISEGSLEINLSIYTSFDTPFTLESLGDYFNENGIIYASRGIGVIGKYKSGSNNYLTGLLFYYDNTNLRVYLFQIYTSAPSAANVDITTSATINDLVIEL